MNVVHRHHDLVEDVVDLITIARQRVLAQPVFEASGLTQLHLDVQDEAFVSPTPPLPLLAGCGGGTGATVLRWPRVGYLGAGLTSGVARCEHDTV